MPQTWNADTYGRDGAFVHEMAGGVLEWLAAQQGERILDLGCGDGQLTLRIAESGASVVGIDSSGSMVKAARDRGVKVDQGSAETLPYPDGIFEAVFSNAALHWVRGQDEMLSQVHRVLRPGGRFVAEMGGHGNIAAIRVAFAAVLSRHGFASLGERGNYYPTSEAYSSRLERHGFDVQKILLFPRPTPLNDGGMTGWLNTFYRGALDALPEDLRNSVVEETVALLAPALRGHDGHWTADYVRLRFIARAGR
ncbi:MAG TPA: methyltransferase domain-containing protein [Terracidiphilus sp.]|jgi:SAM-dependent methyltransferase